MNWKLLISARHGRRHIHIRSRNSDLLVSIILLPPYALRDVTRKCVSEGATVSALSISSRPVSALLIGQGYRLQVGGGDLALTVKRS